MNFLITLTDFLRLESWKYQTKYLLSYLNNFIESNLIIIIIVCYFLDSRQEISPWNKVIYDIPRPNTLIL